MLGKKNCPTVQHQVVVVKAVDYNVVVAAAAAAAADAGDRNGEDDDACCCCCFCDPVLSTNLRTYYNWLRSKREKSNSSI